jgi:adenylate kinase family enzyme
LKVFFAETTPLFDYYEKENKLIKVNGSMEIEEVAKEIASVLRR